MQATNCGMTKERVLLVAIPLAVNRLMTSYPSAVPGTLTMTLGDNPWSSSPAATILSTSWRMRGSSWPDR